MKKAKNTSPVARPEKSGLRQKLNSLYLSIPALPLADRATSVILYATVILYILFTAFLFLSTPKTEPQLEVLESPLYKNSPLMLQPGESYSYQIASQQGAYAIYYAIQSSPDCSGVEVIERVQGGQSSRCILGSGNLAQAGFENVNAGLGNSSILLFSPWMLAASENFGWQVNTSISAGGVQITMPLYFRSNGRKAVAGRDAYEIVMQSGGGGQAAVFEVDSEKRVALLFEMGNATARLVSAPFALDWGNQSLQN